MNSCDFFSSFIVDECKLKLLFLYYRNKKLTEEKFVFLEFELKRDNVDSATTKRAF